MSVSYTFTSGPRAEPPRNKYRDEDEEIPKPMNIMFDRRVVRGNTYAAQFINSNAQEEAERLLREQKRLERKRELLKKSKNIKGTTKPNTPPAVDGRRNLQMQTDDFLEELVDKVKEADIYTQTEEFYDRPPSPLFLLGKEGIDTETQIVQGDLFDFDIEVNPLLEVLVGKAIEQGLMEVLEEEEMKNIKTHQQLFEQKRNAELAEVQRLEAESRRKYEEKQRRLQQEKARLEREKEVHKKVAARELATKIYDNINISVIESLKRSGYFYDPVRKEVQDQFLPWLYENVNTEIKKINISRNLVDELIKLSIQKERTIYNNKMAELAEKRRLLAEERAREENNRQTMLEEENYLKETYKELDRLAEEARLAELERRRKLAEEEGIEFDEDKDDEDDEGGDDDDDEE